MRCDPDQPVSYEEFRSLERSLDRLWKTFGIDVVFTRHFMDRVNDIRNGQQVTACEIENLFNREFSKYGSALAQHVNKPGVLTQHSTNLNVPFVLQTDEDGKLQLVLKTLMRKHGFSARGQKFWRVEHKMGPFERQVEAKHSLVFETTPWGLGRVRVARTRLSEESSPAIPTTRLSGVLVLSESGWCLLDVPNELVQGLFSSLDEPGISLPTSDRYNAGKLNAHISVMDGDEVKNVGPENVRQHVGRRFRYQLGPLKIVTPVDSTTWKKVWYVTVTSPELEEFRQGFGLTPKPHSNEFDFHITVAVQKSESGSKE